MMIQLKEGELELIQHLVTLTTIDKSGVKQMESIIRKYIDHKAVVCAHCSGQIKFAHKRLCNWYNLVIKPSLEN